MSKVHPQEPFLSPTSTPSPPPALSTKPQVLTIWMKSLILGGRGCTVFDSDGQIVYRVDNYHCKCSNEVYLMDSTGKVLCTMLRKKFKVSPQWEGYRGGHDVEMEERRKQPWFKVAKAWRIFTKPSHFQVIVNWDQRRQSLFKIESKKNESVCRIIDRSGVLIAEMKRKQSTSGVILGDDVLTMTVEPHVDQCLVMGLVVAYSLIGCKM
ncbi:hypothetical protein Ancab_011871 [Ancistrocladus abbreviatus]